MDKIKLLKPDGSEYPAGKMVKLKDILLPDNKTDRKAGDGINNGKYPFFTSSDNIKSIDEYDFDGEYIIINTGGQASFKYFNGKFSASSDCYCVKTNECTKFIYLLLNFNKVQINSVGFRGNGIKHLDKKYFNDLVFNIPCIDEQKEIVKLLEPFDNLYDKETTEIEELKQLKKSLLQKMFPKKDSKIPEVRFPGFTNEEGEFVKFTDDWEQRKVSELCSISTGKSNTQDKVEDGEYPFYVRSPIIERSTKYLYDEEAVLTVGDGVGTGKVFHYVNGKYDLHQRCYRMYDFTAELNAHYFYHTFSKLFYKRVMAMTAKTSVDSVRLEMIADMDIPCPDIREQEKIGAYFDNLDNLITLHQRKLSELEKLKKCMMQSLLP